MVKARKQLESMPDGKARRELSDALDALEAAQKAQATAQAVAIRKEGKAIDAFEASVDALEDFRNEVDCLDEYRQDMGNIEKVQKAFSSLKASIKKEHKLSLEGQRADMEATAAEKAFNDASMRVEEALKSAKQMAEVGTASTKPLPKYQHKTI